MSSSTTRRSPARVASTTTWSACAATTGTSAKTGALRHRGNYARLIADARVRRFDVVICASVDRLSRTESFAEIGAIFGPLQDAGVKVVTTSGQVVDLQAPEGQLLVMFEAWRAASENRARRDRAIRGRAGAVKRKGPPSKPPWGYCYKRPLDGNGQPIASSVGAWVLVEPIAELVREIFRRVVAGESYEAIAADLQRRGVARQRAKQGWSRDWVRAIVTSTAYRGVWHVNLDRSRRGRARVGERSDVIALPPIVDEDLWYGAQTARGRPELRGRPRSKHAALLEGLAVCATCGAPIHIKQTNPRYRYYCCSAKYRTAFGQSCTAPTYRIDKTDAKAWAKLESVVMDRDVVAKMLDRQRGAADDEGRVWLGDLHTYEARLARLEAAESSILSCYRKGLITERVFNADLERSTRERRLLEQQVATVQQCSAGVRAQAIAVADVEARLEVLRARLPRADAAMRREVLLALLVAQGERVTVGPDGVVLRLDLAGGDAGLCLDVMA